MRTLISRFTKDESGVTAIEYGTIAALIALVTIPALQHLGSHAKTVFNTLVKHL